MRVLPKLCLLLLVLIFPIVAKAQTETDFFTLLEEAQIALNTDGDLITIQEQLASIQSVTLADGRSVPLDTSYWVDLLDEPDSEVVTAQIDALLASQQLPQSQAQPNARTQLEAVLSRFEIDTQFSVPIWQRVLRWLGRWLQRLSELGGGQAAGGVLIFAAIGVTGLVVFWAMRRLRGEISAESHLPLLPTDDHNLTAQAAFDNAQQNADTGDYRNAVRYLYLSALLSLDERDQLHFDRSKTNREYLRSIAGSEFAPTLRGVIDVFDRVWYGFRPIDSATFTHYRQQVRDLLKQT